MYIEQLEEMRACPPGLMWLREGNYATLDEAWQACERGDWMLWLAGKLAGGPFGEARKPLVLAACECARLVLPYVEKGETRPLKAIEAAEAWAMGDPAITPQMVGEAAAAAYAAAAYDAAAYAAYAAYDAAAYAAAYAAYAAYDDDARREILEQCAAIVRKYYPVAPELTS